MNIIAIFDDGGETFDRYTVVFDEIVDYHYDRGLLHTCLCLSDNCDEPNGFCLWDCCLLNAECLGKEITWDALPQHVRDMIEERMSEE